MKPLYFPFTNISELVLGALLACFKQVAVYQPSRNDVPESLRNWETEGRLQIRLPNEGENDPLPHLLKAYHAWAEFHEGERPDFEKFRPAMAASTDTPATSRIRSDIRKLAKGIENVSSQKDIARSMLLRARLFLTVAQEHDQLQQTLREDLKKIDHMQKTLFRNLISDQDESLPISAMNRPAETTGTDRYLSGERMTAWARLHVNHRKSEDTEAATMPKTPDLLITSDQFALDQLLAQADETDLICSVSGIPFCSATDLSEPVFFNEQRCEKLRKLAAEFTRSDGWHTFFSSAGDGTADTGRLTIYRIKGDAVTNFLSESEKRPEFLRMHQDPVAQQYTLAGSIVNKEL